VKEVILDKRDILIPLVLSEETELRDVKSQKYFPFFKNIVINPLLYQSVDFTGLQELSVPADLQKLTICPVENAKIRNIMGMGRQRISLSSNGIQSYLCTISFNYKIDIDVTRTKGLLRSIIINKSTPVTVEDTDKIYVRLREIELLDECLYLDVQDIYLTTHPRIQTWSPDGITSYKVLNADHINSRYCVLTYAMDGYYL